MKCKRVRFYANAAASDGFGDLGDKWFCRQRSVELCPGYCGAGAFQIYVFNTVSHRVAGMAKMVVIQGRAHVLPALPLVNAKMVTSVNAVTRQLVPHFWPLRVVNLKVFHTAAQ
jgi:hypothetical protein